jgi:hypothetical protein
LPERDVYRESLLSGPTIPGSPPAPALREARPLIEGLNLPINLAP